MPQETHASNLEGLYQGLPCGRFLVKLATTDAEREAVFRLRYQVFNEELGEGIPENAATGLDRDDYDEDCDHLMLLVDGQVVGTYRLLFGPRRGERGFYTETEFDLCGLPLNWDECVELGRGCVAPEYRKQTTLMTLFWALNRYMRFRKAEFLFGCGSLPPMSADDAEATYAALVKMGRVDESADVSPHAHNQFKGDSSRGVARIPQLLTLYLEFGARILGRPAYDPVFRCHDVLVLFDMDHLSAWGNELINRFDKRLAESRTSAAS